LPPGSNAASAHPDGLLVIARDRQSAALALAVTRAVQSGHSRAPEPPLTFPVALGLALLGGLILNLMPCVFPVLAIKALSLSAQGGANARVRVAHGLAYTGGVLGFFAALGILLLSLRAGGTAVGWGFQLQSPAFVALMAYLFFLLGLSLAGAANLGNRLT
jgi:thiol:disulfide interchange protein DsbD